MAYHSDLVPVDVFIVEMPGLSMRRAMRSQVKHEHVNLWREGVAAPAPRRIRDRYNYGQHPARRPQTHVDVFLEEERSLWSDRRRKVTIQDLVLGRIIRLFFG